ncbi:hypothetical protein [Dactylosporangium sp. NPDC051484]|uniref:hypothetical protein n=1 Tax=Dactylosporangium sp. NPDC051484 TaxID=3154942 RepID=UPI0034510E70
MPDSTTPASPEPDGSAGIHSTPASGTPASPSDHGPSGPDAPNSPPAPQEPQLPPPAEPSGNTASGRGGCMTAMIGLFVFIAAVLGIATQL